MPSESNHLQPGRRQFLGSVSATAVIAAFHPGAILGAPVGAARMLPYQDKGGAVGGSETPLISALRLFTAAPLEEMKRFYHDLLGLAVTSQSAEELTIQAGLTSITFVPAPPELGGPFYHFAFNIPHNKLLAARTWQLERTELVNWPANKSDPAYPNDVRHFRSWNAHSLFFWDPANNVVEYIARHDLNNDAPDPGDFSTADILYASEIAFVVDDQNAQARKLNKALGLPVYPKGQSFWWAMGDERGLLLCIPKRTWGTDPNKQVRFDVFPTHATIQGVEAERYTFDGLPYEISVK